VWTAWAPVDLAVDLSPDGAKSRIVDGSRGEGEGHAPLSSAPIVQGQGLGQAFRTIQPYPPALSQWRY
jgi:hypothetical protein